MPTSLAPAYMFKGAQAYKTPGGTAKFAGGVADASKWMQGDVTFNPSIFLITQGVQEATNMRYMAKPLWEVINRIMIPSIRKNFDRQGRPAKWPPLAPATIAIRNRQGYPSGPILQRSRKLKNAALAKARWQVDAANGRAGYGNFPARAWYAGLMQGGGDYPEFPMAMSRIPSRPFAVMQEEDFVESEKIFRSWLSKKMNKSIPKARISG